MRCPYGTCICAVGGPGSARSNGKKSFGEIAPDDAKPMKLFLTARGPIDDYKIAYDFEKAKIALKQNLKDERQERRTIFENKGRKAAYQVELEEEYFEFDQ